MRKIIILAAFVITSFSAELNFKSLQSDFVQVVNSEGKAISYTGIFYAKSDNTALWIYKNPTPKRIYFEKNRVIVIEDELEQAIISQLDDTPNLTQILTHAEQIQPTLYKAIYDGVDYLITLKDDLPSTIDYKDKLGNKIKITLQNTIKDALIPTKTLTPIIPQGYDIINQ
ncbi:outer membrane lipoprotein chaperone LolA [Campylobacter sp. faydin G-105]|uniref:LolA-like outer membrane lipoprotein chaperone n=1 Tax=Campylobacter anatolicus TaxID=2829105 RepID=UPI001B93688E|nr:LolA-like outer membrane lipoprotein chaperone [Campylobacter anatolicus]MBR8462711.1 outer membrane lipoprotein chaperone LolA [Campylobacter anatolicus]